VGRRRVCMRKPYLTLVIFLMCYLFLVFPLSSYGRKASITDIVVTDSADYTTVYARLANSFTKRMDSAILAGVPITFTFFIDLYHERSQWFDEKVSSVVVKQTIKYDNVKKLFYVSLMDGRTESEFQDFDGAKKAMAELNGIALVPLKDLHKDTLYYVMIKAKLDSRQLPMYMEYILFIVSLWDFETDWHRQNLDL
jgi:hypothetical protein